MWLAACRTADQRPTEDAGRVSRSGEVLAQRSQPLLGTFVTISAFGTDELRAQEAISAAFDEIRRIDFLLSVHKTNSEAARLNARAEEAAVAVSEEMAWVLGKSMEIARGTDGAFDPTIGPLAQLWGFIWKEYRLPTRAELEAVLPLVDYRQVELQTNRASEISVKFRKKGMFLDFGGIGKGYAVDRAIDKLRELGVTNAMVKAGGDLRVMGLPPGKDAWEVQIEDPRKAGKRTTIRLMGGALSTSGNYENYFEVAGKRYSHILDPRTGVPVQGIASCTVTGPTCLETDAYATAFFVLGPEQAFKGYGTKFGIRFVDSEMRIRESVMFPRK